MTLLAGTSIAANLGEIKYTLPEKPVKFNEKLDSYVVSWEPMDGIKEYHLGVYYAVQIEEASYRDMTTQEIETTDQMWIMTAGWIGHNTVVDGAGKEYEVEMGIWDGVTLKGDATEVDISSLINMHLDPIELDPKLNPSEFANKEALLGCTMVMTAVRESGEPIVISIEIPIE